MKSYDWVCIGIMLVGAIVQAIRASKSGGMGLPLFEALGVIVAAVGANKLGPMFGLAMHVQAWIVMLVIFVVLSVVAFLVARWLFSILAWSFESMDALFGALWGVVLGWAVASVVLHVVVEIQGPGGALAAVAMNPEAEVRAQMPIVNEVLNFRTWKALMGLLFKAKLGPEFNPDIG